MATCLAHTHVCGIPVSPICVQSAEPGEFHQPEADTQRGEVRPPGVSSVLVCMYKCACECMCVVCVLYFRHDHSGQWVGI